MMKPKYYIILILCILPIILIAIKLNSISTKANRYKKLPSFNLVNYNGEKISRSKLRRNKAIIFMFFNTECDICKTEILLLNSKMKDFQDIEVVLVSIQPIEIVNKFIKELHLKMDSNMYVLIDEKLELISSMDINSTPVSLIYDTNRILTKRINGFVKIETLLLLTKNNYGNYSN